VTQATYTSGKDASDPDKQISVKYTYDDQDRLLSEVFVRKDKVGTELTETHLSAQHSWPANGEHHIDVRDKEGLMSRRVHMLPSGQFSLHEDFSEGKRIRGEYYQYDEKGEILEGKEVIEGEDGLFSRTETFQYDPASGHLLEVEIREHERDKLTQTEPVLASLTREIFRGDEAQTLLSRTQTSENAARIVGVMDKPTHTGNLHNPDQVKTSLHSTETFRYNDQGEFLEKEHLIQETYAHF
jgi:YD repeat-containing protein